MKIPFGEWLPDLPSFDNPGSTVATNVIPGTLSYKPMPGINAYSTALDSRCQGFFFAKDSSGNSYNYAGDATKIYSMTNGIQSDISKPGGYNTASDQNWFFSQYNNMVIATNYTDDMQAFIYGTSATFDDLGATAPKARFIAQVLDFTLVGNTYDGIDGNIPHRIRWCAIGDPTDWTVSPVTQADYQDLDSSKGEVKQVIGGEYGVIFQDRAISIMTYVGSPEIFQIRQVEANRGLLASGSAVKFGNYIAYLGIDGFYIFDGTQSIPIGDGKINKTFFSDVDMIFLDRISSMADLDAQVIYWAYPGAGNIEGRANKILVYNYAPNAKMRWSIIDSVEVERLGISISEGYTMDALDSITTSVDDLDNYVVNLDSSALTGNNYILSGYNSDHRLSYFTGDPLDATITTTEGQLFEGKRGLVTLVKPLVDTTTGTITISLGTRNKQNEAVSYGMDLSENAIGEYPTRSNARFHRAKVIITGGFNHAMGIEVLKAVEQGER